MTRFARAVFKKKIPHEASSWKELSQKSKKSSPVSSSQSNSTNYIKKPDVSNMTQVEAAKAVAKFKNKRSENRRLKRVRRREASKVCFHCRVPGHGMSDCPVLKEDYEQGADICFKCGSTEHAAKVCSAKMEPGQEFAFAKCFVCGETGHLSNACPDNPRGLYPNGGCCGICGSVEHFKKDCPDRPIKDDIAVYKINVDDEVHNAISIDDDLGLYEDPELMPKPVPKKTRKIVRF